MNLNDNALELIKLRIERFEEYERLYESYKEENIDQKITLSNIREELEFLRSLINN